MSKMSGICSIYGCNNERVPESLYCQEHQEEMIRKGGVTMTTVQSKETNSIKLGIEQTAKGVRVTVTLIQVDHQIDVAVQKAVDAYELTIDQLKERGLKVDES